MTGLALSFAATPATRSAARLQKEVAFYVAAPDDPEALELALLGLNDSIRRLNMRNWSWALDYDDIYTVAGTGDYTLSSGFRAPRAIELFDTDSLPAGSLNWYDPKTFVSKFPVRGDGSPCAYTAFNVADLGTFTLDCAPTADWVDKYPIIRLRYFRNMEILALPTDTITAPSHVESFVTWHAKMTVAASMSPERVGLAESQARIAWSLLLRDEIESQVSDWSED